MEPETAASEPTEGEVADQERGEEAQTKAELEAESEQEVELEQEVAVEEKSVAVAEAVEEEAADGHADGFNLLLSATADDDALTPPEVVEALAEAAADFDEDDAAGIAQWFGGRLAVEAIPVRLKTLSLLKVLLEAGSGELGAALKAECLAVVGELTAFAEPHPELGDRPAAMIREAATVAKGMLMRDEQASGDKGLYCTADHDDLFASALAKRGKKLAGVSPIARAAGGGAAAGSGKPVSKFTFKSGVKNMWKDVKDSGTIATKVWRVTLPTAGGGEGKATFISVRHAAANLSLLFDGHQEHEWIHPEKEEEADYAFSHDGLGGVITVTRLGPNKYGYSLDIPGEIMDMAEHWLTATVELDSVRIPKATIEGRDTPDAFVLYEVHTTVKPEAGQQPKPAVASLKRFGEFHTLHKLVKSSFASKLATTKAHSVTLPKVPGKTLMKRYDEAFVEKRRAELETYLQCADFEFWVSADVLKFLGVLETAAGGGVSAAAGGGGGGVAGPADLHGLVEAVTIDDTEKPDVGSLAALARAAMVAGEEAAGAITAGIAERLQLHKIPVHMKTLTLLQTLLSKGSMCCQLACKRSLLATVEDIEMSFFDIDPEHGSKPSELIRSNAAKILRMMQEVREDKAAQSAATGISLNLGTELSAEAAGWLESVTAEGESKPPPAAMHSLLQAARLTTSAIPSWIGLRLVRDSIAIKLKTLMLVEAMLPSAVSSTECRAYLAHYCLNGCQSALHFRKMDDLHGERPAALVREVAARVEVLLVAAGKEHGVPGTTFTAQGALGGIVSAVKAEAEQAVAMGRESLSELAHHAGDEDDL